MSNLVRKEINVILFDEKRDRITSDCIYWVHDNTLFPFETNHLTDKDYEAYDKIESLLSLNDCDKTLILAKLLKKELHYELSNGDHVE